MRGATRRLTCATGFDFQEDGDQASICEAAITRMRIKSKTATMLLVDCFAARNGILIDRDLYPASAFSVPDAHIPSPYVLFSCDLASVVNDIELERGAMYTSTADFETNQLN
jgi:hypothetical protein